MTQFAELIIHPHGSVPAPEAVPAIPLVHDEASARALIQWACDFLGDGWHPDTRADQYITRVGENEHVETFNESQALFLDAQIDALFRILDPQVDIYAISNEILDAKRGA